MKLMMQWEPDRQTIWVEQVSFTNYGKSITDPCHDMAHLIAAACGLPWDPTNHEDQRHSVAELNAVLIEHCLWRSQHIGKLSLHVNYLKDYSDWFIDKHYAPFPIEKAEALRRFQAGLNVERMIKLAPYFYRLQEEENKEWGIVRNKCWKTEFDSEDSPVPTRIEWMKQVCAFKIMAGFFAGLQISRT